MREWGTSHWGIEPDCEWRALSIGESTQNARVGHILAERSGIQSDSFNHRPPALEPGGREYEATLLITAPPGTYLSCESQTRMREWGTF
jgi:hypothetical protein